MHISTVKAMRKPEIKKITFKIIKYCGDIFLRVRTFGTAV